MRNPEVGPDQAGRLEHIAVGLYLLVENLLDIKIGKGNFFHFVDPHLLALRMFNHLFFDLPFAIQVRNEAGIESDGYVLDVQKVRRVHPLHVPVEVDVSFVPESDGVVSFVPEDKSDFLEPVVEEGSGHDFSRLDHIPLEIVYRHPGNPELVEVELAVRGLQHHKELVFLVYFRILGETPYFASKVKFLHVRIS